MRAELATASLVGAWMAIQGCAQQIPVTTNPPAGDASVSVAVDVPVVVGERWSGTFAAMNNRSAEVGMRGAVSVHGSVLMTPGSTPEWTRVALNFSGYRVSTLGWYVQRGRCGMQGDMLLPPNAFPLLNVSSGTNAQATTELHFALPAPEEALSVNVYRADGVVSQASLGPEGIVGCSNLKYAR